MRVGIMQPYFFPYIGYFQLINSADHWVFFDIPQYIRHGWVNRNRVLHPKDGWQYILIPLHKAERKTPINDMKIHNGIKWKARIIGQLTQSYKKKAPNFLKVIDFVNSNLNDNEDLLVNLLTRSIQNTCNYLNIKCVFHTLSKMRINIKDVDHPGQWALRIAEQMGASEYINPIGGRDIFRPAEFAEKNIKLKFLDSFLRPYKQSCPSFEAGLSIIDCLMWNDIEEVKKILDDCELRS